MVQTFAYEQYEGQLTPCITTKYSKGAVSKRYLDKEGMPIDTVWIKPLNVIKLQPSDVIEHREVELYNRYFNL